MKLLLITIESQMHIRYVMLWEFEQGNDAKVTIEKIRCAHSENVISDRIVKYWFAKFPSEDKILNLLRSFLEAKNQNN